MPMAVLLKVSSDYECWWLHEVTLNRKDDVLWRIKPVVTLLQFDCVLQIVQIVQVGVTLNKIFENTCANLTNIVIATSNQTININTTPTVTVFHMTSKRA
jgi:hypothetical protein